MKDNKMSIHGPQKNVQYDHADSYFFRNEDIDWQKIEDNEKGLKVRTDRLVNAVSESVERSKDKIDECMGAVDRYYAKRAILEYKRLLEVRRQLTNPILIIVRAVRGVFEKPPYIEVSQGIWQGVR